VLAAELRAGPARLEGLELDDGPASLPAVLAASYRALDPAAAELLRLLGGVPGAEFEAGAVVSLYGENPPLRTLEDSSLLTQHAPGRYRMHDLVRLYAASFGDADALALRRFVDHHVHLAFRGDRLLAPLREPIALDPPTPGVRLPVPAFADADAAVAWFAREHGTLLAVQRLAVARGWYPAAWQLAWAMDNFHYRHGRVHDHVVSWEIGLDAASRSANGGGELLALRRMGAVAGRAGASGMEYLRRALDLAVAIGDGSGQAAVHQDLAVAWGRRGDDGRALEHSVRAASLYRAAGDTHCEANALNNVGWFQARVGRHEEARRHCARALALHRGHGDRESEAGTLDSLGFIAHAAGEYPEAVEHYTAALALFRELDHGYGQASALCGLGEAHAALGHPTEARAAWTEALDLYTAQHRTADADDTRSRLATL
ncbi:MAG TPA: tetratricopeptide repeat protein, partial [Pseudonocardiaceae bacterium]